MADSSVVTIVEFMKAQHEQEALVRELAAGAAPVACAAPAAEPLPPSLGLLRAPVSNARTPHSLAAVWLCTDARVSE